MTYIYEAQGVFTQERNFHPRSVSPFTQSHSNRAVISNTDSYVDNARSSFLPWPVLIRTRNAYEASQTDITERTGAIQITFQAIWLRHTNDSALLSCTCWTPIWTGLSLSGSKKRPYLGFCHKKLKTSRSSRPRRVQSVSITMVSVRLEKTTLLGWHQVNPATRPFKPIMCKSATT